MEYKAGSLRVWYRSNLTDGMTLKDVGSIMRAKEVIRAYTKQDLANDEVSFNAMGLEIYEDVGNGLEWCEWYNDNAEDIGEVIELEDDKYKN